MQTSRAGLAGWLFEVTRLSSQALEACSRVLKKRAAQSHLSMRVPVMDLFSLGTGVKDGKADHGFYGRHGFKTGLNCSEGRGLLDGTEHAAGEGEERGD